MQFADTPTGRRRPAATGEGGICPHCGNLVIAKCGPIVEWHWAHEVRTDCDPWAEPETAWHAAWKARFPPERCEVTRGAHRADVVTATGWVLEFQHSPISVEDIQAREDFYGDKMLWVLDGGQWARRNFHFRRTAKHGPNYHHRNPASFRWRWPRRRWAHARRTLFLDLGEDALLRVHWVSEDTPCGGWGTVIPARAFIEWVETGQLVKTLALPETNPLEQILASQLERARARYGAPVYEHEYEDFEGREDYDD